MTATCKDARDKGRPSSWSGAIDSVTSGYQDGTRRLFVVSAGNVDDQQDWAGYPQANQRNSVHDPGQSWNAITVGAYTEKDVLTDPELDGHTPLAQREQLSPFSTTSSEWDSKWPVKPDLVAEGGNLASAPDGFFSEHDELSLLSTGHKPTTRQFGVINATSAAAAQVAWLAAQIQAAYPEAWPETVRALLIHSADWPEPLKKQFLGSGNSGKYSKTDYGELLRIAGYGVPDYERAMACAANSLTLISQAEIQPYKQEGSSRKTKDMHLHRIPWPKEILEDLGETPVTLRITLSYFVEPSPGEIGWKDKYRYASSAFRFGLSTPGDDERTFLKRLNKAAREDEERSDTDSGSGRWVIGQKHRDFGSIHSDMFEGTAADISTTNLVGIYPVIGWWRERAWLGRCNNKTRYSLIISIRTPEEVTKTQQKIDIYTPVANKLKIPIEIVV